MLRTTYDVQRTTYNVQRTTYNVQRATSPRFDPDTHVIQLLRARDTSDVHCFARGASYVARGSDGRTRTRACRTRLDAISYQWQPGVGMSADAARTSVRLLKKSPQGPLPTVAAL